MNNLIRHYLEEAVVRGESWDSDEDPNDRISAEDLLVYFDVEMVARLAELEAMNKLLRAELAERGKGQTW